MGMANKQPDTGDTRSTVQSVGTAFDIVECIYDHGGLGVTELANVMDLPTSTAHVYLKSLHQAGYVVKDDGQYDLSYSFLRIGGGTRAQEKIYQFGLPAINSLADETGELIDLLIEEHGMGVVLDKSLGVNAIDDQVHIGTFVHLHSTASGKAILANLPEERIEDVIATYNLPQLTPNTITDREELLAELAEIRDRGVAINDEEQTIGLRAIGAPIIMNSGDVLGSISICGTTRRMSMERMRNELEDDLVEATNIIELQSEPAPV